MASATDTAKADGTPRRRLPFLGSRLGRLIAALNLLSLAILVAGALVVNEQRRALVDAREESLTIQGRFLVELIAAYATYEDPALGFDALTASEILQRSFIFEDQRARLTDREGRLVIDSNTVTNLIEARELPPLNQRPNGGPAPDEVAMAQRGFEAEVAKARSTGEIVSQVRRSVMGERVVSVSIPIRRVRAPLGVLTIEAGDFNEVLAAQRKNLIPFILVAVGVSLLSSVLLARFVARPVVALAHAADRVRLSRAREISLPGLARRDDEIGDLTRALQAMTGALSQRMDAIEAFAADVAHEIRNPLTSIRSAVETLDLVQDEAPRRRLLNILKQDVGRLDRLITDISNASRLDAELSRDPSRPIDLGALLVEMIEFYGQIRRPDEAEVVFDPAAETPVFVNGRETPLGQVFRNLVDNARSFSPPGAPVVVRLERAGADAVVTVDDSGPGIPPDNLETVFERFYTSRPKGAAFGGNSGLGLSIARQIVEAHGGRVWAENRRDEAGQVRGARFHVTLPESGART
jgi:two-component system sensor histidine kinase ChvG